MLKLVVLSALIACGTAAPSLHHSPDQYAYAGPVATYAAAAPVLYQQEYQHVPALAKVAEFVEHVPSSVSHHSSAIVHSSAAIATPVITPVAKATIVAAPAPVFHAAPVRTIQATPIVEEVREAGFVDTFHAAPVLHEVSGSAHDFVQLEPQVHQAAYAKVGEFVEHVPSSVSHHSSSVVHSSAAVATPVITQVAKATIVAAPAPVFHAAPVLQEVHGAVHDIVEIHPEIQQSSAAYAKVGEFVEHVPSSVSHHSSSVVHSSAAVATPVITPVAKATIVAAPAPVYQSAPLLQTVHAPAAYAVHAPAAYAVHAPAAYAAHAPAAYAVHAPAAYAAHAPAAYALHEAPLYNSLPYAAYNHGPAYHSEPLLRSW